MIRLAVTRTSCKWGILIGFWVCRQNVATGNQEIIMQHARIYRAWLLPEIFPKYVNNVENNKDEIREFYSLLDNYSAEIF